MHATVVVTQFVVCVLNVVTSVDLVCTKWRELSGSGAHSSIMDFVFRCRSLCGQVGLLKTSSERCLSRECWMPIRIYSCS